MEELKEAKEKAIEECKSFEGFFDDVVEGSVSTFHKGFIDYKNKMNELFPDINIALLIPSIIDLTEKEEAMEV